MPRISFFALVGAFAFIASAFAQPVTPPTNSIEPTVTASQGDLGGRFFGAAPVADKTRRYYIAAEPQLWDYAPQGLDPICGKPLPPPVVAQRKTGKVRYVQYTDETFTAKVIEHPGLGILGPVMRGVVGDFIVVTFLNRTAQPLSMHPHGVKYDKDSEGSYYQPKPGRGAAVGPNAKFTYVWHMDEASGPRPDEPSSKGWLYHSHVEGDDESNAGLIGFIIVTDPKRARPDGTPADVDREIGTLFMNFDESGLGAAEKEAAEYASLGNGPPAKTWAQVQELLEHGERPSINGYIFGNTPGLEMNEGERVRWYLFALGSEKDFHTAHWHGVRALEDGRRRTDVIELLPASMKVADITADNPGTWLFHCHVAMHMQEGMFARLVVHPKGGSGGASVPKFFGLRESRESLRIERAEALLSGNQPTLTIEGEVTVPQAHSIFISPVTIQMGNKSFTFKMDRRGVATTPDGTFTVKNASEFGVIYGGMMKFSAKISGAPLPAEVLSSPNSVPTISSPITVQVGRAQHSATAHIAIRQ